jgi:hypothetical protein
MHVPLASLAHACVPQLREAMRRLSVAHAGGAPCPVPAPARALDEHHEHDERGEHDVRATAIEWEDTCFDIHQIHA